MTSTERFTPQQERTWSLLVGVLMWLPAEFGAYLTRKAALSHAEFGVLRCLSSVEDREIHRCRLAAPASVTPSHLSRTVSRLERRGLITRTAEPTDRRKTLARLTVGGVHLVETIEPGYVEEVRDRVFHLVRSDQLDGLEDLAEAILTPLHAQCMVVLPPRTR